jgi:catechol 2,3-dioxygenase-like lactoylglutathione lyase family enzyme
MFNKLFAICILVDNFEKSFDFYKNKLGLEVNSSEGEFADFKLVGTSLAIFGKSEATAMFPKKYMKSGGGIVIAYQVNSLNDEVERLKKIDVEIFEGPKETAWGQKVAYFNDPDGNILEVSEK